MMDLLSEANGVIYASWPEEPIGYYMAHYLVNWPDEPIVLADDYLPASRIEPAAESLRFGILAIGDEIDLLVNDRVVSTVVSDGPTSGELILIGGTPRGCGLAFDNFRLWKLDE